MSVSLILGRVSRVTGGKLSQAAKDQVLNVSADDKVGISYVGPHF